MSPSIVLLIKPSLRLAVMMLRISSLSEMIKFTAWQLLLSLSISLRLLLRAYPRLDAFAATHKENKHKGKRIGDSSNISRRLLLSKLASGQRKPLLFDFSFPPTTFPRVWARDAAFDDGVHGRQFFCPSFPKGVWWNWVMGHAPRRMGLWKEGD